MAASEVKQKAAKSPDVVKELGETEVITLAMLRSEGACAEGVRWVKKELPEGAAYGEFVKALEKAKKPDWADWLIWHFGADVLAAKWRIAEILAATASEKISGDTLSGDSAQIGSSGYYAKIGSSGDYAKIGSSGDYAKIGSSGYSAQIGSSGDSAKIGSSGDYAKIGSSGDSAQIGSSGDYAKIGSSGYYAKIGATGKKAVVAAVGGGSIGKMGEEGCLALMWRDSSGRPRLAVGYAGEDLQPDVWYGVDAQGKFVEADATLLG